MGGCYGFETRCRILYYAGLSCNRCFQVVRVSCVATFVRSHTHRQHETACPCEPGGADVFDAKTVTNMTGFHWLQPKGARHRYAIAQLVTPAQCKIVAAAGYSHHKTSDFLTALNVSYSLIQDK